MACAMPCRAKEVLHLVIRLEPCWPGSFPPPSITVGSSARVCTRALTDCFGHAAVQHNELDGALDPECDSEAEIVRSIFRRYAELGSVRLLKDELRSPKDRQPIVDERFGSPRRRQAVLTRRALPDFAEPYPSEDPDRRK